MASRQSGSRTKHISQKAGSQQKAHSTASGKGSKAKPVYAQQRATQKSTPLLDETTKRDLSAVILIILGIVLFAVSILSPEGVVTGVLSFGLRSCLGIGAYVLPFLLITIAITILIRFERERVPARVAIGLALIFVAFLTLVSLFTPGADVDPNVVFNQGYLMSHAGYIGGGLAWACLTLFGLTVSTILMAGLIIIALIIIGFSLSSFIEGLRARRAEREEEEDPFANVPRVTLGRSHRASAYDEGAQASGKTAPLSVSPDVTVAFKGAAEAATQVLNPSKKAERATQVLPNTEDEPGESALQTKRGGSKRKSRRAALPTEALDTSSEGGQPRAVQMTRKLRSKPTSEIEDLSEQKPPAKKKPSVAAPEPMEGFELPDMALLNTSPVNRVSKESEASLRATAQLLQETLSDFGVNAEVAGWVPGPTVTLFKIDLPSGVRVSRVSNLNDDIALALAAPGVRIFAPVPGTNYVGIEVPNKVRETVLLGDVLKDAGSGPLQIAIGKDVEGESIVSDLATMPHLLIGGTTGSGKSVAINGMIMSILMRATPSEVRMIMIDPKRVEFTPYNGIPHLYVPVVTESREAASALSWAVAEMERRLKVFSGVGARNIGQYNAKVQQGLEFEGNTAEEMPYLVIVIDELADLMMNVGKEVEFSISRLAQLARAAGIHLIVATQRPSTNVVTGLIKANITNRIAFNVASGIDSRVILDTPGAENLIGLGDLLLSKPELAKPQRIQGCYVSEEEIAAVVEKLKSQGEPEYHNDILKTNLITLGDSSPDGSGGSASGSEDPLVWDAAEIVVSTGMGSTSNLQRRLSVGYSRAGRIMDLLEAKGIVGPPNGSKPREVLVTDVLELETLRAFEEQDS